jgi:hypothetical protein
MVGALGPAVRGVDTMTGRRVLRLHVGSLVLGAWLAALVSASLGTVVLHTHVERAIIALGILGVLGTVAQLLGARPLQARWQVPERWRRQLDIAALAIAYGLLLGMGVMTAVTVTCFWTFVALGLVVGSIPAMLGWSAYGLARGAAFVAGLRTTNNVESLPRAIFTRRALSAIAIPIASICTLATYAHL